MSKYAAQIQMREISGYGHYHNLDEPLCENPDETECGGLNPIDERMKELYAELNWLQWLKKHIESRDHDWSEITGICLACGWDGNA